MAILLTVLIFVASSFSSRLMCFMTACHLASPLWFLCDPCYCNIWKSIDGDVPFKMSLWDQGRHMLHTLELRHRGWKIHSVLYKKCVTAGQDPVLVRWFLSSPKGDQFTMNHKTYLMKKVSGFWNQVPLGSFYLCANLGVGSILARKNINWKVCLDVLGWNV